MADEDIVTWFIREICTTKPTAADALALEQRARQHWGGQRTYIVKQGRRVDLPETTLRRWVSRGR